LIGWSVSCEKQLAHDFIQVSACKKSARLAA
jgi:hypothetical protein